MNNNGQNAHFERDSRVRRTADSNAMGKRFEDIKKRYASGAIGAANDSHQPPPQTTSSASAIFRSTNAVTPGGAFSQQAYGCQQTIEKDSRESPTFVSSFTDMIASKRELFFKQQSGSSLAGSGSNSNNPNPASSFYYGVPPGGTHQQQPQTLTTAVTNYNMPILSSAATAPGKGAPYDYGDRDKPLSSYIGTGTSGGTGPGGRFASSKPSFRTAAAPPMGGGGPFTFADVDDDQGSATRDSMTSSPPMIMPASVTGGGGVSNRHIINQSNGTDRTQAPATASVERCIGFANLPNQFYRRAVKRGFEFTLMVVGESGLGKSTLINSLFLSDIYSEEHPGPSQRYKKTVDVDTSKQILIENGVQLSLTIVDTPGFGDSVDNSECWQKILDHIENKYEEYLNAESRVNRITVPDSRIHCCLYFIAPSGHGLKSLDIEFMKKLHDKVNILPLISKADTMMPEEIARFKKRILSEIKQHSINIYEFPLLDDPEDNKRNKELRDRVPFAIMGSNLIYDINNRKVRGRKYPWGIAEVENPDHCDFLALRDMLIRRHMQNMKDVTSNILYENYRRQKLSGGNPNKITADNPMTQLEDERREQEENLHKTEQEMEQVFAAKVKEKEQKIKESKLELEKRYEQMKRTLDEQMRELEERRKTFELEKQAWEGGGLLSTASHTSSAVSLNGNINPSGTITNGTTTDYGGSNGSTGSQVHNGVSNSMQSLASSKKGHIYNDASIKEVYDEKEKKKEKKRFF